MFLELVAVIFAGFAGAGLALLLVRLIPGRPRWIVPVGAGAAMLAATISSEYSWYARTAAALPEGLRVVQTRESRAAWRPWSYLYPLTEGFIAVDTAGLRANAAEDGLYLANVYFYGRWRPLQAVQFMVDCPGGRLAPPAGGDGAEPAWQDAAPDDPILGSVCEAA